MKVLILHNDLYMYTEEAALNTCANFRRVWH